MLRLLLLVPAALAAAEVEIVSSLDGARQPAIADIPSATEAVPLLVHLHSWSSRYNNSNNFEEIRAEAQKRGWAFVSPDFRGVNDQPAACGSELAVQDVLDTVEWMKSHTKIDERRIYLAGSSGGGYMALMLAGRAPHVWAGVSAWVPISDLAAWHAFSVRQKSRYAKMMEGCFGTGPVGAAQQFRRRSPVHFLQLARGLPLDIQTGIRDGHEGSVPVSHSLLAFNAVAAAADRIPAAEIEALTRDGKVAVPAEIKEERAKPALYRRQSGAARVTIFDGAHEADFGAAVRWLEKHRQPAEAIVTELQDDQVLQRDSALSATIPAPQARGGQLMVRVNGGDWQAAMPRLRTGGPYRIDFRVGSTTVTRQGILVGDIYLLAGQSNMVGRAPLVNPAPAHPLVRAFTPQDTWESARDPIHEAIPRDGRVIGIGLALPFAKEMVRRTGVPIGLVPCAIGGTSLEQWNPARRTELRRSLYGNFVARAKLAGGAKAVLWYQGEADASARETAASYAERFQAWVKQMRADLGPLPIYYAQLARNVVEPSTSPGWDIVREAQRLLEPSLAPGGMVATVDLPLTDPIHLDRVALEILGKRLASRILDGPAPAFKSAEWDGPSRLRLRFTQKLSLPSGARVHGFTLGEPGVFHALLDAGDVVLLVGPAVKSRELYYCRGVNPVCDLTSVGGQALPAFGPVTIPDRARMVAAVAPVVEDAKEETNIYRAALVAGVEGMARDWGRRSVLHNERVLVDESRSVKAEHPKSAGGYVFNHVSPADLLRQRQAATEDFPVLSAQAAQVEGSRVKVALSQDYAGLRKSQLLMQLSGWAIVYLRINPVTGNYQVDEVKLGGI